MLTMADAWANAPRLQLDRLDEFLMVWQSDS
jgi:hypothetical protein